MKIKLPVVWSVCGTVEVEANSIDAAMDFFSENIEHIPLPEAQGYVDGSFGLATDDQDAILMENLSRFSPKLTHRIEMTVHCDCCGSDFDLRTACLNRAGWHTECPTCKEHIGIELSYGVINSI